MYINNLKLLKVLRTGFPATGNVVVSQRHISDLHSRPSGPGYLYYVDNARHAPGPLAVRSTTTNHSTSSSTTPEIGHHLTPIENDIRENLTWTRS